MTPNSHLIDFAAVWRAYQYHRDNPRLAADKDREFWDSYAPHYDARTGADGTFTQTLSALLQMARPCDRVLDVGAGTGRFGMPLARVVRSVTALDHAPAMLNILRAKLRTEAITNVSVVEAAWEDAEVEPHDFVLAAWSLYRQVDIAATLAKLVRATRRTLVIVAGDDFSPPHRPLVKAIWGRDGEPDVPACLYLLGALWQIGARAELRVVYETRGYTGATPLAVAAQLAPVDSELADAHRLADGLTPYLTCGDTGCRYRYQFPVSLIVWHAEPWLTRFDNYPPVPFAPRPDISPEMERD